MKTIPKTILSLFCSIFLVSFFSVVNAQTVNKTEIEQQMMKKADQNIEKFRKGDVEIQFKDKDGKSMKNATIEVIQKTSDFLIGCIIFDLVNDKKPFQEELFKERFKKLFNLAVFPFYWPAYENQQGKPQWEKMNSTLEWCKANGITTKGHPLVWACHSGAPKWLNNYSPDVATELLKARVINTVGGFKNQINLWDVVNEPVNVRSWKNKLKNLLNENDWDVQDSLSGVADYVEQALRWAHSANPEAILLINEYKTIPSVSVRNRYAELLKELKKRNAPLSGIGIQAHEPREEWFSPQDVWNTFDLYSGMGFPIHITELMPQSSGKEITGGWRTGKWTEAAQAEFAEQFFRLCFGHPGVASVNWWGLSDRNIWLEGGGLIDKEYNPKPVYQALDKLINETWKTNLTAKTGKDGNIQFRGFFGNYEIKLTTPDGKSHVYPLHVGKNQNNILIINVE
jgi:endo-1,4-beta-xylanase